MSIKSPIYAIAVATVIAQPALAEDRASEGVKGFERRVTENWTVQGIAYPDHARDDVCVAFKQWKDGSKIEVVKDLTTGELRIWHQPMGWNRINDEKMKRYTLRMNMYDQQGNVVDGGDVGYTLINKNTFVVTQIMEKRFMKAFVNANRINFIPEGNVSNTQVFLDGKANDIAVGLSDCVQASAKAPATVGGRAPIEPPSLDLPSRPSVRASL